MENFSKEMIKDINKEIKKETEFSFYNNLRSGRIGFYSSRVKKCFFSLTIIIFMTLSFSCFNNGVEEPDETDPVIEDVNLDYSQLSKSLFISAKVIDPQGWGDIDSVSFYLYHKDSASAITEDLFLYGNLSDDGPPEDIIKRDDVYSYIVDSSMIADNEGFYRVTVLASDSAGNTIDIISETEEVKQNSPPVIYLLEAPNSFERGDTLVFRIRASDIDGLDDIVAITYSVRLPDGNINADPTFQMRDDGKLGDEHEDDGIFTVEQPTNTESKLQGLFTFYFVAKDYCGALSDTITVPVSNPGVTIIHPNESDTLHYGNTLTIEWESAYISKLKLEYTMNSNGSPPSFESIADNVSASKESYDWIIPFVSSDFCKIRVSDKQQSSRYDLSDNPFSIEP